jgi:flagellar protein FliO/FliZ
MSGAQRSPRVRTARRVAALVVGVTSAHLLRTVASAQEAATEVAEVGGGVSSFGVGDWVGLVLRLALVLGVIWGAVAAMRWYVRRTQGVGSRGALAALEVLETHALGPNRALHLVRLGDRAVLVGATPERITSLMTVDDPEEVRRLTERPETSGRRSLSASLAGSLSGAASTLSGSRANAKADAAPRAKKGASPSPFDAMTTGLVAFREMLPSMPSRARADVQPDDEADEFEGDAIDPRRPLTSRLRGARGLFDRVRTAQEVPASDLDERLDDRAPRRAAGLFERTLAAAETDGRADAAEFEASRALRARNGYAPTSASVAAAAASVDRERRIADVQRAIAEARRNAG